MIYRLSPLLLLLFILTECSTPDHSENQSTMTSTKANAPLLGNIDEYIVNFKDSIDAIVPAQRKKSLDQLAAFIREKNSSKQSVDLIFICTHNSRRSHMSQLWAQTAAHYYHVENVHCYSGGTEATAFNHRSVRALRKAGFSIEQADSSENPVYMVTYTTSADPIKGFSKKYDDAPNPMEGFVAIMTCSQADKACPVVAGAVERVAIPYEDPKVADDTPEEEGRYDERCRQIAVEMFYVFSKCGD